MTIRDDAGMVIGKDTYASGLGVLRRAAACYCTAHALRSGMEHQQNIEQQITEAWKLYVATCLEHNADGARAHMRRIDALLECVPRQPQPEHAEHIHWAHSEGGTIIIRKE